jgi:serine protease Do
MNNEVEKSTPLNTIDTTDTPNTQVEYISKTEFKRTITFVIVFTLIFATIFGGLLGFVGAETYNSNTLSSIGAKSGIVQNLPVVNEQSAVVNAVKKANPSVVSVIISQKVPQYSNNGSFNYLFGGGSSSSKPTSYKKTTVGAGSGFIVGSNGYILTNKHVVANPKDSYTVVMNNGKTYSAKIVGIDPTNDIAVIKINANNLPTLTLGTSSNLELGSSVIAIGNALGQYQNTIDTGVVSGINRSVQAQDPVTGAIESLSGMIQTDAQINPGNSGGPLLNLKGQVIGMNTAVSQTAHGIGFAIPINQAKADIASVLKNGKIIKPELGVQYEMVTPGLQHSLHLKYSYGAYIVGSANHPGIVPNTPAQVAGLKNHDIILDVNGNKVTQSDSLSYLIGKQQLNSTIKLKVYQNGHVKNVNVTLNKAFK